MLSRVACVFSIALVAIGVGVGLGAARQTTASAEDAERSSHAQGGSSAVQPVVIPLTTGSVQPTADFALAVDDEDPSAEIPAAPSVSRTQDELYWTGEGPGDELRTFVAQQRHADLLLVSYPAPDGPEKPNPPPKCNLRDTLPGPKAIWAACGIVTDNKKVVRQFFRADSVFPAQHFGCGKATLACGSEKWGYRHIKDGKQRDWENIAAYDNVNWREAADWGMWTALKYPKATEYRASNDTFSYRTPIYLKDKRTGKTVKTADVITVVASKTKNIITAYPTNVRNF